MNFDTTKNTTNNFTNKASTLTKEERLNKMTNEEKINMFAPNAAKMLAKKAEYEVPENGQFSKCLISFDIPGTQNIAYYLIEHDVLEPKEQRRLSIGALRNGCDRLTSIQLKKGTKKEILDFLNDENNAQLFRDTLVNVSNSTDEYFS